MNRRLVQSCVVVLGLLGSSAANAWFFFIIPTGAIKRGMETDPDSISVSQADRKLGQCGGFHLNQMQKGLGHTDSYPDENRYGAPPPVSTQTPESKFHSNTADLVLQKASERDKVKKLAEAYSVRWSRVASADRQANLQYGATLARGCQENDFPVRYSDLQAWQLRQEEKRKYKAVDEENRLRVEEERRRARAEEAQTKTEPRVVDAALSEKRATSAPSSSPGVDYIAEAKKSARILGCPTGDVRITGAENSNVLMSADCGAGTQLLLRCDQSGTCLRR